MRIHHTPAEVRQAVRSARREGKRIGVVPTMGALHAGHLSLVAACQVECDFTVVTIYVNPTQFGPNEDLARYPRQLESDLAALDSFDVDIVFAPSDTEMYPPGASTFVEVEGLTDQWEGAARPTHFRGVTTIVAKLFNAVEPDVAYFGQKDYQQSLVVRQMAADLDFAVDIRVCPIVREADGLALSSRNVYLSPAERRQALALSRGLELAQQLVDEGTRDGTEIRQRLAEHFARHPDVRLEYIAVVNGQTMHEVSTIDSDTVVALAARVGQTRLIDNARIELR